LSVQFTPSDTTNYNSVSKTVSLTVNKINATINVNGYTGTYDGNAHGASGTATGVNNENLINLLHLGDSFTNVAGGTANWTFDGNTNYNSASGSVAIVINKADTKTTVSCDAGPFTYTGSAHTPCSASVSGPGSLNQAVTPVTYTDNTNAGTATASATYAGNGNYNASSGSTTFTIGKASSTTTVTCPANVTYTGSALTPCSATVTGAGGLNQSLTVSYTNNTDSGTVTASASFAGDTNHTGSSDSKNFNINFNFTGFASPVDNNNVLNTAKAGQAIPLKWRLTDASGNPVTNLLSTDVKVTATSLSCSLGTTIDLLEEYATGSSGLQNLGNGYYQFNWSTPKSYASSCKTMTLSLGEGTTTHTALFQFTR
jgi:hypothetical protein